MFHIPLYASSVRTADGATIARIEIERNSMDLWLILRDIVVLLSVITVPHQQSAMLILEHVRKDAPHVHVIVRSRYDLHVNDYVTAGAHVVVGDESQVGEYLAHHLCEWLG